jgi:hypothetical protein
MSVRQILTKEQYIKRHDRVRDEVHFNICKEIGVEQTDRTIRNNKPDIEVCKMTKQHAC